MTEWMPLILATIGVVGGGGGLYSAMTVAATRRKMLAEADSINANTATVLNKSAIELLQPFRDRIHELEREVDESRAKIRSLTIEVDDLRTTVRQLNAEVEIKDRAIATLEAHFNGRG